MVEMPFQIGGESIGCVAATFLTALDPWVDLAAFVVGKSFMATPQLQIDMITQGTGPTPRTGQVVKVHYTGWLTNGAKFDSSVDRDEPFQFVLGRGEVISGWDLGVARMRVGDKARLTIPPEHAYGREGYPGVIPPNATLVFEVELLAVG